MTFATIKKKLPHTERSITIFIYIIHYSIQEAQSYLLWSQLPVMLYLSCHISWFSETVLVALSHFGFTYRAFTRHSNSKKHTNTYLHTHTPCIHHPHPHTMNCTCWCSMFSTVSNCGSIMVLSSLTAASSIMHKPWKKHSIKAHWVRKQCSYFNRIELMYVEGLN